MDTDTKGITRVNGARVAVVANFRCAHALACLAMVPQGAWISVITGSGDWLVDASFCRVAVVACARVMVIAVNRDTDTLACSAVVRSSAGIVVVAGPSRKLVVTAKGIASINSAVVTVLAVLGSPQADSPRAAVPFCAWVPVVTRI